MSSPTLCVASKPVKLCNAPHGGTDTHLWICVLTDSGATRRPRVPIPKSTCTNPWILEVFKRKGGPKRKPEAKRRGDGVACKSAELNSEKLKWMISPPLPRHTVASLRTVGMTSRTPLLIKRTTVKYNP